MQVEVLTEIRGEVRMKSKYSEEKIVQILSEVAAKAKVLCRISIRNDALRCGFDVCCEAIYSIIQYNQELGEQGTIKCLPTARRSGLEFEYGNRPC